MSARALSLVTCDPEPSIPAIGTGFPLESRIDTETLKRCQDEQKWDEFEYYNGFF